MLKKEMRKKADERNGVRKSKERLEEVMGDNIRGNVFLCKSRACLCVLDNNPAFGYKNNLLYFRYIPNTNPVGT